MIASHLQLRQIWILIQASLWSMDIKSAHNWRLNDYNFIYVQCRTVTDRGSDACVAAPLHYLWWLMKSSTTGKHGMTCYYRLKQSATNRFPFYLLNNVQVQRSTVRAPCGAVNISWLWAGLPRVVWLMLPKRRRIDEESVRRCGCVRDGRCLGPSWRFQPRMKQLHLSPAQTGKLWILWIMCLALSQTGWSDGAAVKGVRWSVCSSAQRIFCSFLRKMSTPLTLPVKDQDCGELRKTGDHVFEGRSALFVQTAVWGRAVVLIMTERRLEKVQSRKEDLNKDSMINIL